MPDFGRSRLQLDIHNTLAYNHAWSEFQLNSRVPWLKYPPISELHYGSRRYRGTRAGTKVRERESSKKYNIPTRVTAERLHCKFAYKLSSNRSTNLVNIETNDATRSNLIVVPRIPASPPDVFSRNVTLGLLNTRSVNNKSLIVKDFTVDNNVDILAVTETWLRGDIADQRIINDICPTGYSFRHLPRTTKQKGGGVGFLYRTHFKLEKLLKKGLSFKSFEFIDIIVNHSSTTFGLILIYRPPPSSKNGLTFNLFLDEFGTLLEMVATLTFPFVVLGDFNVHVDSQTDPNSNQFLRMLDTFDLAQHVNLSTHKNGHTLDLVITRTGENFIRSVDVIDPSISDHLAILCDLSLKKPGFARKEVVYRKLRSVDVDKFIQDIKNSELMVSGTSCDNVCTLVDNYNSTLTDILDNHAPLKKRVLTLRPAAPWYTNEIKLAKAKRRKLERHWRKTQLTVHREMYTNQCKVVQEMVKNAKTSF